MDDIYTLQRPDHYLELDDLVFRVPLDHINAVDDDAVDLCLKLEHSVIITGNFTNVSKTVVAKNLHCGGEVFGSDSFAGLGCMNDRRIKNYVIRQQIGKFARVASANDLMPGFESFNRHNDSLLDRFGLFRLVPVGRFDAEQMVNKKVEAFAFAIVAAGSVPEARKNDQIERLVRFD